MVQLKKCKNPVAQSGFFRFFDAPWSEWSRINLLSKETENLVLDLRIQTRVFPKKRSLGSNFTSLFVLWSLQVDFQLMEIMRPTRQIIRRTFTPGVSLEFLASPNEMSFFAKINSVQVRDNSKDFSFSPISPRKILNLQRSLWWYFNQICGRHQ